MSFFDKIKTAIRKIKDKLIVFGILVLIIIFWFIIPFVVAKVNAEKASGILLSQDLTNSTWWNIFLTQLGSGIQLHGNK